MHMEEFEASFNETVASMLSHVGVSAGCAAQGQPLFTAIRKADLSTRSVDQLAKDPHTHW